MKVKILGEEISFIDNMTKGDILFMIHGNMSAKEAFKYIIPYLKNKRLIAFDLPGFGDSTLNSKKESLEELSKYAVEFIKKFGFQNFSVLGWSMGGGILYEILKTELKENMSHATFVSSMGIDGINKTTSRVKDLEKRLNLDRLPSYLRENIKIYQEEMKKLYTLSYSFDQTIRKNSTREVLKRYVFNSGCEKEILDFMTELAMKEKDTYTINRAIMNYSLKEKPDEKVKKLFLHGSNDLVVNLKKIEESHKFFKNTSSLKILENFDHAMIITQPEKIAEEINKFMEEK